jgi:hypothetical protein
MTIHPRLLITCNRVIELFLTGHAPLDLVERVFTVFTLQDERRQPSRLNFFKCLHFSIIFLPLLFFFSLPLLMSLFHPYISFSRTPVVRLSMYVLRPFRLVSVFYL